MVLFWWFCTSSKRDLNKEKGVYLTKETLYFWKILTVCYSYSETTHHLYSMFLFYFYRYRYVLIMKCSGGDLLSVHSLAGSRFQYVPGPLYRYKEVAWARASLLVQCTHNEVCMDKLCTVSESDRGVSLSVLYQ